MMKFKVGDRVRVRNDLIENKEYYMKDRRSSNSVVDDMLKLRGRVVTIKYAQFQYQIEEYGFNWTDEMFEPFAVGHNPELREIDNLSESHEVDTSKLFELLDKSRITRVK